jgi:hypothetical protein
VLAADVVHRVEDVDVLATDARLATEAESDVAGAQARDGAGPTD